MTRLRQVRLWFFTPKGAAWYFSVGYLVILNLFFLGYIGQ